VGRGAEPAEARRPGGPAETQQDNPLSVQEEESVAESGREHIFAPLALQQLSREGRPCIRPDTVAESQVRLRCDCRHRAQEKSEFEAASLYF
jgi:hypothetical protein